MNTNNIKESTRTSSIISRTLADGRLAELVYSSDEQKTRLVIGGSDEMAVVESVVIEGGEQLIPIAATNNLIQHGVVVLPEKPEEYESTEQLLADIDNFIGRYLDLSPAFRQIAGAYMLLSWVFDAFNELPYLRLRGDFGTGKTRALTILGSLCHKAFFASGASTVSPIFYTLDSFKGTLILDEADFRFSDEKSEIIKILNNGNVRGFPVLRQSMTKNHEFTPRAFDVFGPKIVAMRHTFDDPALESRFLTEEMGQRPLRSDIPINLPDTYKEEALTLRNKLLTYRFRTLGTISIKDEMNDDHSARVRQILRPLLAVIPNNESRMQVMHFADGIEAELKADRALAPDGMLLEVLVALFAKAKGSTVSVSEIASMLIERFGRDMDRVITPRYVGQLLRKRLFLKTYKTNGIYVVPVTEREKVLLLAARFGISGESHETV